MAVVVPVLLDTDTLSEVMRRRDPVVQRRAKEYLAAHGRFTFSIITRYEVLRGLKAKGAIRQEATFERRCLSSTVLPLTDSIIVRAAEIYADLKQQGQLISDADIFIAATALTHGLKLATNNTAHYGRIVGLRLENWKSP
jgi:tRNA(fMet)-specific endonuclease VapC